MRGGMAIVVCLDTRAPRLIAAKKASDRNMGTRLFAQLKKGDYDVRVPQVVVGEAVTTAMRYFGPGAWEEPVCRMLRAVESVPIRPPAFRRRIPIWPSLPGR